MRKIIYALIPIIAILFFSVGCSDDVIKEEPVVTITVDGIEVDDKEGVILSKDSQDKTVSVSVNTGGAFTAKWSNIETTMWAKVVANATGITISVDGNSTENSRVGLVTITTTDGLTSKFIKVHQNGSSVILDVLPDRLDFNQLAGSKIITINTDAVGKWSIINENDWITIIKRVEFKEAIVAVTENTTEGDRVAKIVVTAGSNKKEITINQTKPLDLIMPFLDFTRYDLEGGNVIDSIKKFELARGSQYAGLAMGGVYQYRTPSKNFPEVWYSVNRWDKFLYQVILQPSNFEVIDSPDFKQLILDHNFEFVYTSETGGYTYYWREVDQVMLVIDRSTGEVQFFYPEEKPIDPGQKEDLPTFDEIPTGFSDWNATKVEIGEWETAQGGTLKADFPIKDGFQQFVYKTNKTNPREEFERVYWMDERFGTPQFMQTMLMYKDFTLAYFHSINGEYYLTKEFRKLMADNGFENLGPLKGEERFQNLSKNLNMFASIVDYDDGSGTPEKTILISLQKADNPPFGSPGASSMQILR